MMGPPSDQHLPRGRPFPTGMSGNPGGRPRRTEEEAELIEACREKTAEALAVVASLTHDSANDRVRLAAAQFIIERTATRVFTYVSGLRRGTNTMEFRGR